jgi:radical SAM protein with 4Fe4S-binding SPASM domain
VRPLQAARRALVPAYQKYVRKLHELKYLFLELTTDCNLECLHCGSDCYKESHAPRLPAEAIVKVLTEIRDAYRTRHHRITVALTGGEPLCYPNVFSLGKAIHALGFPWGMVTNGFAWSEQKIIAAKDAAMSSVTVSLDGLEKNHDWLRGRKGSFAKAVKAIALLTAERFWQAMDVVTCVNQRNLSELGRIHDLLIELGVPAWRLFIISPIGRATQVPELFLNAAQFQQLLETIQAMRRKKVVKVSLSESGYLGAGNELCVRDQYFFCLAGINVAGIMVNGDILACPNLDRRLRQGNIRTDSFVDIWEHRYQPFRDRAWMKAGRCASCVEWKMCQGNSLHLWDLDAQHSRLCHFHELRDRDQRTVAARA